MEPRTIYNMFFKFKIQKILQIFDNCIHNTLVPFDIISILQIINLRLIGFLYKHFF